MTKKVLFGFVAVYAFTQLADAAIHQFILDADYEALAVSLAWALFSKFYHGG